VDANVVQWDDESHQPIERRLSHIIALLVRSIKFHTAAAHRRPALQAKELNELVLTQRDVEAFLKQGGVMGQGLDADEK